MSHTSSSRRILATVLITCVIFNRPSTTTPLALDDFDGVLDFLSQASPSRGVLAITLDFKKTNACPDEPSPPADELSLQTSTFIFDPWSYSQENLIEMIRTTKRRIDENGDLLFVEVLIEKHTTGLQRQRSADFGIRVNYLKEKIPNSEPSEKLSYCFDVGSGATLTETTISNVQEVAISDLTTPDTAAPGDALSFLVDISECSIVQNGGRADNISQISGRFDSWLFKTAVEGEDPVNITEFVAWTHDWTSIMDENGKVYPAPRTIYFHYSKTDPQAVRLYSATASYLEQPQEIGFTCESSNGAAWVGKTETETNTVSTYSDLEKALQDGQEIEVFFDSACNQTSSPDFSILRMTSSAWMKADPSSALGDQTIFVDSVLEPGPPTTIKHHQLVFSSDDQMLLNTMLSSTDTNPSVLTCAMSDERVKISKITPTYITSVQDAFDSLNSGNILRWQADLSLCDGNIGSMPYIVGGSLENGVGFETDGLGYNSTLKSSVAELVQYFAPADLHPTFYWANLNVYWYENQTAFGLYGVLLNALDPSDDLLEGQGAWICDASGRGGVKFYY